MGTTEIPRAHFDERMLEAATEAAWEENRRITAEAGMEMPTWPFAGFEVKQRWRSNTAAALAAYEAARAARD